MSDDNATTESPAFPRYDYGPIQTYELIWATGHVERIQAHQVMWPRSGELITAAMGFRTVPAADTRPNLIQFHGQIDGKWRLVLSAPEEDIRTIRLITDGEPIPVGDPQ